MTKNKEYSNRSFIAWIIFLVLTMVVCSAYAICNAQQVKSKQDTTYVWKHPNYNRCSAMTKSSGYKVQCKKTAVKGSTYCTIHQSVNHQYN